MKNFVVESITNNIPAGTEGDETIHDHHILVTNNIFNTRIYSSEDMIGDFVKIRGIKNVGTLTANSEIGENRLKVNSSVTDNVYKGMEIELDNTVIKENLGRIIDIDTVNHILTMENTATNQFVAGSMIRLEVFIDQCIFTDELNKWPSQRMVIDRRISVDILRVKYTNNSGTAKTFYWDVEYFTE